MSHTQTRARRGRIAAAGIVAACALSLSTAAPAHAVPFTQSVSTAVNAATGTISAGFWNGVVCKYLGWGIGPQGCR